MEAQTTGDTPLKNLRLATSSKSCASLLTVRFTSTLSKKAMEWNLSVEREFGSESLPHLF